MELFTNEKVSLKNGSVFQKVNDNLYIIKEMLTVKLEKNENGGISIILSGREEVLTESELEREIYLLLENCFRIKKPSLKTVRELVFSPNTEAEGA